MNTADEIKALREEIARLRERIAVLEAQQGPPNVFGPFQGPIYMPSPTVPWYPGQPFEITCEAKQ